MNGYPTNSDSVVMGGVMLANMLAARNHTYVDICETSHQMGRFSKLKLRTTFNELKFMNKVPIWARN